MTAKQQRVSARQGVESIHQTRTRTSYKTVHVQASLSRSSSDAVLHDFILIVITNSRFIITVPMTEWLYAQSKCT